mgnify:CR=1 FL=1
MDLAKTIDGQEVYATEAKKGIPYFCLHCDSHVILARGEINRPHFRHPSAKTHKEVLECENYVSNYIKNIKIENVNIHENEIKTRSSLRLELCNDNGKWNLYMRFPIIKSEFHSLIDKKHLYFQIHCEEENHQFSSANLLGFLGAYKIPIRIREFYTITVSDPNIERNLNLTISGVYRPFDNKVLLFKFIHGSLLHVPYQNVILSGRFFVLTKINLLIPKELLEIDRQKLDDYMLYELQLPDKISSSLIDWFSRTLNINLLPATSHLDLIYPNEFRLANGLLEIKDNAVKLLISHNGTAPNENYLKVVGPDGKSNIIRTSERLIDITLDKYGFYYIYLINQYGEMYEIHRVSNLRHEVCKPLVAEINGQQLMFSETIITNQKMRLTANCRLTVFPTRGTPYKLDNPSNFEIADIERLHVPFVWSIKSQLRETNATETMMTEILKLIEKRSKYREVYIGAKRFRLLRDLIVKSSYPNKVRLLVHLNMKPGFVPSSIIKILQKIGDFD